MNSFIGIQKLGKGSFGRVYLVNRIGKKKEYYAMKVLEKVKKEINGFDI